MPNNATKHITRPQAPIGAKKDGKLKIKDGDTGAVSWRQSKKGFRKDYDGDPTSKDYNAGDMKSFPKHSPHFGGKSKGHQPHMGQRDPAYKKSGE